jgi:hypothetical protein
MGEHNFTYALASRADVLAPDLVPALRAVGVEAVYLGIESASPATLVRMNKVHSTAQGRKYVRDALELLQACFENDMTPFIGLMLPFPGDSEDDFQASLEFAKRVDRLYSHITAQTGVETGFICYTWNTKIYDGSPLAHQLERDFPETVLQPEPFIGESTVLSPSPTIAPKVVRRYQTEIDSYTNYTSLMQERMECYFHFSIENFLAVHSELTDDQGITTLGGCSPRSPHLGQRGAS